jgi:hypothetical protein
MFLASNVIFVFVDELKLNLQSWNHFIKVQCRDCPFIDRTLLSCLTLHLLFVVSTRLDESRFGLQLKKNFDAPPPSPQ